MRGALGIGLLYRTGHLIVDALLSDQELAEYYILIVLVFTTSMPYLCVASACIKVRKDGRGTGFDSGA